MSQTNPWGLKHGSETERGTYTYVSDEPPVGFKHVNHRELLDLLGDVSDEPLGSKHGPDHGRDRAYNITGEPLWVDTTSR